MRKSLLLALVLAMAPATFAGVVGTSGDIQMIAAPPSADFGVLQSDDHAFGWLERQSYVLPSAVSVDITQAGIYNEWSDLTPGVLSAGMQVDSYMLHVDPVCWDPERYRFSVTFDRPIVGIIVRPPTLDASDAVLGAPGTTYGTGVTARGLELGGGIFSDVLISTDLLTLTIGSNAAPWMDEARVVTIPEPGTMALLGMGLFGIGLRRRRTH